MSRTSRPMTVTLGDFQEKVEARVASGAYASASEVLRAGLRALDREEEALNDWIKAKVDEALNDPRPSAPLAEVAERLRLHMRAQSAGD